MLDSHFTTGQQLYLLLPIAGALAAVWLHTKGRSRSAIELLTIVALLLRLFAAHLDPYLNEWDECFHALVAKNMLEHPFAPMLHWNEAMPVSHAWTESHIWLNKPPFFLWQIALSLKVFGLHPWAVRLPSALWLSLLVPVVYRMGRLLLDERAAFIAALFTCFSYYLEELTAAAVCNDHNDAVFIPLVACSWWTLLEYRNTRSWKWALLTGVFSACAVLTKWYVGLSVFVPWGVMIARDRFPRQDLVRCLTAFAVVLLSAGSWMLYTAWRFPADALAGPGLDLHHLTSNLNGDKGSWTYHFHAIGDLMPPFTWWLVLPAMAWLVWSLQRSEHRLMMVVLLASIHLVFAIARTKMPSYTMVLFPIYVLAMANALIGVVEHVIVPKLRHAILTLSAVAIAAVMQDLERLQYRHTLYDPPRTDQCWRQQQLGAMASMDKLAALIPDPAHSVVFNIPAIHHIQFMFHTGIEAWNAPPAPEDVARLRAKGYTVFVLQDGAEATSFPAGITLIADTAVRYPDVGRPVY